MNDNDKNISKHPQYAEFASQWHQMRDSVAGELTIKEGGQTYLPMTAGQKADKQYGRSTYEAYKQRSIFYDYCKNTVLDSLGLLHKEKAKFIVPDKLLAFINNISKENEDAQTYLRRIHEQQLIPGRCGLLIDIDDAGLPKSVLYNTERILNWDTTPDPQWIILDESNYRINVQTMEYEWINEYLLLALDEDGNYFTRKFNEWTPEVLIPNDETVYPLVVGKPYTKIPFTFVNAASIVSDVDQPPLLPVSNISLSIYRSEADLQQSLFLQGQATLFLKGFKDEDLENMRFGAGSFISSENKDADGSFLEIGGSGLSESRENVIRLQTYASSLGVELQENQSESGSALNTRLTVRTSSLQTIAKTAAAALKQQIEYVVEWFAYSQEEEIQVLANVDFVEDEADPVKLNILWSMVQNGGLSKADYHKHLLEQDLTELPYEEWLKQLEANPIGLI